MRLFGSIKELVSAVFRKDTWQITLKPNDTEYVGDVTLELPPNLTGADVLVSETASQPLTNKTIDADSNTVTNIDNGNVKAGANIARNKLASGTASHVVINDGSGVLSSEAQLAISRGGTNATTASGAFNNLAPTTTRGDIIKRGTTDNERLAIGPQYSVLKTDDGTDPGWGLIANNNISATASIAHSKLAGLLSGNILVGNASNVPTSTAVTGDVTISNTGVTAISSGVIVDGDVNSSAAIARSKLANGTANHVVINNGTGAFSSEQYLGKARGGAGADMSSVTFPSTGTLATLAGSEALSNKTITASAISSDPSTAVGTGALKLPTGNSSTDRPTGTADQLKGMVRYNDTDDVFEGYNELGGWSSIGGGGTTDRVTQASHGFVVGDTLYLNGSTYTKAIATSAAAAEVVGVVSRVIDSSTFEITLSGEVSGLSGLITGEVYFLSAATAGALTTTEPSVIGQVSVPVGVASSASTLYVAPKRGMVVGGSNARTEINLTNTTSAQTIYTAPSGLEAGELAGWVYINATTPYRFYLSAKFAKNGAATDWNISYQTSGDTPPTGFSVSMTSGGLLQVTMNPVPAGFSSGKVNYSINGPAVGASFPLSVDSTQVNFSTIKAKDGTGLVFQEDGGTTTGTVSDAGSWTLGPSNQLGLAMLPAGTAVANLVVQMSANACLTGAGAVDARSEATRAGGAVIVNAPSGDSACIQFYANQDNDGVDVDADLVGSVTSLGAWTLGPSGASTLTHTFNSAFASFINQNGKYIATFSNNGNGANVTAGTIAGELAFAARHNGSLNDIAYIRGTYEGNGTTRSGSLKFITFNSGTASVVGTASAAGDWSFLGDVTVSGGILTTTEVKALGAGGLVFKENGGATRGSMSDGGAWTLGSAGVGGSGPINVIYGGFESIHSSGQGQFSQVYSITTTATDDVFAIASDVGGSKQVKWRVEADGDTISTTGSYTSDIRVKKDIEQIEYGLNEIMQLTPISYRWKYEDSTAVKSFSIASAQQIQQLMPEMVREDGQDFEDSEGNRFKAKAVYEKEVVAVMVKAIQELKAELDAAKAEIAELKNK